MRSILVLFVAVALASCRKESDSSPPRAPIGVSVPDTTSLRADYDTTLWSELTRAEGFVVDMRYATEDNFTSRQIYRCGRCFLRPEVAQRLRRLQKDIHRRYGWALVLYDCYRPRPAQQRLWDAVPDPSYVTPPHKGSMHNRGLAVDLTIADADGTLLDMGTAFDFFGPEAHVDYMDHTAIVLRNRRILIKLMELHGFAGIRTEWWHYSLRSVSAPLSDWEWACLD